MGTPSREGTGRAIWFRYLLGGSASKGSQLDLLRYLLRYLLFKKWYLVEVVKFQLPTKQDLLYCRRIVFKISDEHPVHFKRENTPLPPLGDKSYTLITVKRV